MHGGVKRFLKTRHMQDIFDYFIKYVGSSAYHSPAFMNCMPTIQFRYDLWYVDGGLYHIAARPPAADGRTRHQGPPQQRGHRSAQGRRPRHRHRHQGRQFHPADIIVSNMEVIPAYENCCARTTTVHAQPREIRAVLLRPRARTRPRLPIPAARPPQLLFLRPPARAFPHRLPQTPVAARSHDLSRGRVEDRPDRGAAGLRLPEDPAAHPAHRRRAPADPRGLPGSRSGWWTSSSGWA
jgi:hypothetical protein